VAFPEDLKKLAVAYFGRVKVNLHGLRGFFFFPPA
jgi:hypothetical protein